MERFHLVSAPPASKNVSFLFVFLSGRLTLCLQKLNRHQNHRAVFGADASSAEARMKGGKSISIVAQTLSGSWGSAQPFGMSPGRERETPAAEQTKTAADDSDVEGVLKAQLKNSTFTAQTNILKSFKGLKC